MKTLAISIDRSRWSRTICLFLFFALLSSDSRARTTFSFLENEIILNIENHSVMIQRSQKAFALSQSVFTGEFALTNTQTVQKTNGSAYFYLNNINSVLQAQAADCYPSYTHGCSYGDGIQNVYLEGEDDEIDDSIQCSEGVNVDRTGSISLLLTPGETYSVTASTGMEGDYISAFIDLGDGFELVGQSAFSTVYPNYELTFDIDIPEEMNGQGVLRIMSNWYSAFGDACGSFDYGSSVDYEVKVGTFEACTGADAGEAMDDFSVCAETGFVLDNGENVSSGEDGLTYLWESSEDGDSWDEAGTKKTLNVSDGITTDTYYRLTVTCSAGSSDTSDPVKVSLKAADECYCTPTITNSYSGIKYIFTDGAEKDIPVISPINMYSPNGYYNLLSSYYQLETYPGQEFEMSVEYTLTQNKVAVWVDWDKNGIFDNGEESDELIFFESNDTNPKVFSWTIPYGIETGKYRMRVRGAYLGQTLEPCGNEAEGTTVDFTLEIGEPLLCIPTDLILDSFSTNSADISWTAGGGEDEWEISWGLHGYTPGDGDINIVTSDESSYHIANLDSDTDYDVYVRSLCGQGYQSEWIGPLNIYTGYCIPIGTNSSSYINDFSTSGGIQDISNLNSGLSPGGYDNFSVEHKLIAETGEDVNFTAEIIGWESGFRVWIDWNKDLIFDPVNEVAYQSEGYLSTHSGIISIPGGTSAGIYRMRIVNNTLNSTGAVDPCSTAHDSGEFEDYSLEVVVPPCSKPFDLALTNISTDSADISWTAGGNETEWFVVWGALDFNPVDDSEYVGSATVQNNPEFQIIGLDTNTNYQIYVRSDCGGETSNWSDPLDIFTGYCEILSDFTSWGIGFFETKGGFTNISNHSSATVYSDFTQFSVSAFAGQCIEFTIQTTSGTGGMGIWIDWNKDMQFNQNEQVYASGVYIDSVTGKITIPESVPVGNYRMRVVSNFLTSYPTPCGDLGYPNYGEAEDYTISIIDLPSCRPPSFCDLDLVTYTDHSAIISWSAGDSEEEWKVTWGAPGFDPDSLDEITGLALVEDNPEYQITDLDSLTSYEFYVKAVCAEDNESIWVGPKHFSTTCTAASVPFFQNFEGVNVPGIPSCASLETNSGNAWMTTTNNGSFWLWGFDEGKLLMYPGTNVYANSWYFTRGINLKKGHLYNISYKYGNFDYDYNNTKKETLRLAIGNGQSSGGMFRDSAGLIKSLAYHKDFNLGIAEVNNVSFMVESDGMYYFGFQALSSPFQSNIYLDDISIEEITCNIFTNNSGDGKWGNPDNWDTGIIPSASDCVFIPSSVDTLIVEDGIDAQADEVIVQDGGQIVISDGGTLTVGGSITNNSGEDAFVIEDGGNLIQTDENAVNSGSITAKKNFTFSPGRQQYNFVISPLVGQSIKSIYPDSEYVIEYHEDDNFFYDAGDGDYDADNPAKGFAIKESGSGGASQSGSFTGVPFNGTAEFELERSQTGEDYGYNLAGNPYPSAIDIKAFWESPTNQDKIESTFWFWDNRNNMTYQQQGQSYDSSNYAIYNAASNEGTPAATNIGDSNPKAPDQYVNVGTAFILQAKDGKGGEKISFSNSMRTTTNGTGYFGKEYNLRKDVYRLVLTTPLGIRPATTVVYFAGGDDGFTMDDSRAFDTSENIYTLVDGNKLAIQGKKPFRITDVVPLGVKAYATGMHTIGILNTQGVFANGQRIFLRDKRTGVVHDLTESDYTFRLRPGEYNDRFEIIYTLKTFVTITTNDITINRQNNELVITSTLDDLAEITLYDLMGMPVYNNAKIIGKELRIPADLLGKQVLMAYVKTAKGEETIHKIINK